MAGAVAVAGSGAVAGGGTAPARGRDLAKDVKDDPETSGVTPMRCPVYLPSRIFFCPVLSRLIPCSKRGRTFGTD